jgi:predicted metalloprotease
MRARPCLALVAVAVLLTGCGLRPGDSDGTPRQRIGQAVDDARRAVEDGVRGAVADAKDRQGSDTGDVPAAGTPRVDALRTDTNTAFDYQEYSRTLEGVIRSLQDYWSQALPSSFGATYSGPSRYVYYRSDGAPGPTCGGQPAPPKNAFYCPTGDFLAWDETGLMIPYYVSDGDFAAAFVLAHEFGHAMQARLPAQQQLGVVTELQADCFAGTWSRHVQDQGLLSAGDLDEATFAVFSARDVPGTAFTDPGAHGTGFERTRAFTDGYEGGPTACFPAPQDDWLISR